METLITNVITIITNYFSTLSSMIQELLANSSTIISGIGVAVFMFVIMYLLFDEY